MSCRGGTARSADHVAFQNVHRTPMYRYRRGRVMYPDGRQTAPIAASGLDDAPRAHRGHNTTPVHARNLTCRAPRAPPAVSRLKMKKTCISDRYPISDYPDLMEEFMWDGCGDALGSLKNEADDHLKVCG